MLNRACRLGLVATLVFAAAACGGDDDEGTDAPETSAAAATTDAAVTTTEGGAGTTEGGSATTSSEPAGEATTTTAGGGDAEPCTAEEMIPEFRMAMNSPPQSLDPSFATSSGSNQGPALAAIFSALMKYNIETGEVEPQLAESLEPNDDFTEWTLKLRPGMTFGNGAPLNTEAVRFSVELHRAPETKSLNAGSARLISEMQIVSDTEMIFKLAEPWAGFPITLGPTVGIPVDPATYQSLGAEGFAASPEGAGAGPFELQDWVQGQEIALTAKTDYWGTPACIQRLVFAPFTDARTLVDAFANGEIDGMHIRGPEAQNYVEEKGLEQEHITQVVNGGSVLLVNQGARGVTDRPAKDIRVRQAIALALDPAQINERVYAGVGEPSKALLSTESAFYTPDIKPVETDPAAAKALLDEVKAETGYDGHLYMPAANTPAAVDAALIVKAQLDAVGFNVELDTSFDSIGLSRHLTDTADYDIMMSALSMFDSELWGQLSRRVDYGTPQGWIGYDIAAHPEWPAAMDELRLAATVDEQKAAMVTLSEIWNETVPMVVLDHHQVSVYWQDGFEGFDTTKDGIALFDDVRPTS